MDCKDIVKKMLGEANAVRSLIYSKCQATFFGHVMRREKLVTSGMVEGSPTEENSVKRFWVD